MARKDADTQDMGEDSDEEKELSLNDYDRSRKRCPPTEHAELQMNTKILATELTCPICLDLLTMTMTTKECLHRFCSECISMALLRGNKECPTCRTKLVSKRSLRHDANFDELIRKIWPDRHKYEEMLAAADEEPDEIEIPTILDPNEPPVEEMPPTLADALDNDAPTPPALMDDRDGLSVPPEDQDETGGRTTPVWMAGGSMKESQLSGAEKKHMDEVQKALATLKAMRGGNSGRGSMECEERSSSKAKQSPESEKSEEAEPVKNEVEEQKDQEKEKIEANGPTCSKESTESETPMEVDGTAEVEAKAPETNGYASDATDNTIVEKVVEKEMETEKETEKEMETEKKEENEEVPEKEKEEAKEVKEEKEEEESKQEEEKESERPVEDESMEIEIVAERAASPASSSQDSESEVEDVIFEGEVDTEDLEELDQVDQEAIMVNTWMPSREQSPEINDGASTSSRRIPGFDPRTNPDPPYAENPEQFHELNPLGKGFTWTPNMEQIPQSFEQVIEDDDEEVVYDEDDLISAYDIDDILQELELDVFTRTEKPEKEKVEVKQEEEETEGDNAKYMNEETRENLREINQLKIGSLQDIKMMMENPEVFEMADAVQWYTQLKDGEELIYYEKSRQPVAKGKKRDYGEFDPEEEEARIKRRVSLKQILDDMSDTDSESDATPSSSLISSEASSPLSLSEIEEAEEEEEMKPGSSKDCNGARPPHGMCPSKERLHRWLADAPAHPLTPDDDHLERKFQADDENGDDGDSPPENYEIEAELRPAATLLSRNVPKEVLQTRYIRAHHKTSMEHFAEYLYQRWIDEVYNRTNTKSTIVPRPEYFYVFNRSERHCKYILLHESLLIAQAIMSRDDHVVIYFDTEQAKLSSKEMSLLEKVVPQKDLLEYSTPSSRTSTGSSSSH